ncbi:MAG: hypothetical protein A2Y12_20540 [Planctomycetes bacterium GWF2_42_9]|nr:MAG: hypothetical protein A2Y12_20540 [Planctomycetes bacterium GWF2_42_9]
MKKQSIVGLILLCLSFCPAKAAKLLFFADFNKDCNSIYANGSPTAAVNHDQPDNYPNIGLSNDGQGKFISSTPNKALYCPNTDTEAGNFATNEFVKYNAFRNFNYEKGTFAVWVKPTLQTRFYKEGRIIGVGEHPLGFANSWFLWDYDGYDSRHFTVGGTDGNGNQGSVSVALNSTNGYDFASLRDRWFFVVASWEHDSVANSMWIKISVRDQYSSSFITAQNSVSMTNVFNDNRSLLIGTSCFESGNVWGQSGYGGYIDWAQIYDDVLDDANMAALYNSSIESIAPQMPAMPRLTFMATFNNSDGSLNADYAYVSETATVYHDASGISPDISQSPDGSGKFSTSTPNRAFYNPNSAFWDGIQFDGLSYEYLKYSAQGHFKFDGGTFAMWYKPTVYRPLLDALLIGDNVHWSYPQSWYFVHRQNGVIGSSPETDPVEQLICFYGRDLAGNSIPTAELTITDGASKLSEWIFVAGTWKLDSAANKLITSVWYRKPGDSVFKVAEMGIDDPDNYIISPNTSVTDLYVGSAGTDGRNGIGGYIDQLLIYDGPIMYYGQLEELYFNTVELLPNPDNCGDVALRNQLMVVDLNKDCVVDMKDILQFGINWLKCNDPQTGYCQ